MPLSILPLFPASRYSLSYLLELLEASLYNAIRKSGVRAPLVLDCEIHCGWGLWVFAVRYRYCIRNVGIGGGCALKLLFFKNLMVVETVASENIQLIIIGFLLLVLLRKVSK